MDIFKLGDKILALLEAVFGFWNNQISLVFAMLGQSPVSFKGGGPWAVIEGIEPVFVAVGSSLVVLFFVIGFCSESIDVKDEMRFESILRMLIRLGLAEWFVANNVTIMKAFFTSIGNLVGLISAGTTTQLAIDSTQAETVLKQLETIGVLGEKNEAGEHKVIMDRDAFINRIRGYQNLAERMMAVSASKNTNLSDVTISKTLIVKENDHAVKTRVPGTWGENARYVWLNKENIMDIHSGKTMLTFIDSSKDYKLYDEENRVVETKRGDELYRHYDKVEASVRERYEKTQAKTETRTKTTHTKTTSATVKKR